MSTFTLLTSLPITITFAWYIAIAKLANYHMVGNLGGVQIFMDFVRSAYPRKITEF